MHHPLSIPALSLALAVVLVAIAPPAAADAGKPAWSPGDFWAYSHTGSVFDWVNGPGTYRVDVGMYDASTQIRLPVFDEAGQPVRDNVLTLGSIQLP